MLLVNTDATSARSDTVVEHTDVCLATPNGDAIASEIDEIVVFDRNISRANFNEKSALMAFTSTHHVLTNNTMSGTGTDTNCGILLAQKCVVLNRTSRILDSQDGKSSALDLGALNQRFRIGTSTNTGTT